MIENPGGISKKGIQWPLVVGAVGVVYGDIGTSPLYALKACLMMGNLPVTETNVLGLISLFIWSLVLIASVKYVYLVSTVDHHGEGGILVLSSLCAKILGSKKTFPIILGILGAALFFGDGIITPAISVLSALEGLKLTAPWITTPHIIGAAVVIILGLFLLQKRGSGMIGNLFGPIMVLWFLVLAGLGIIGMLSGGFGIVRALLPWYALKFFWHNGFTSLIVLGGTILVVTGAEALYADMGHFGRNAIKVSWNFFVFPCLILNYLGQGSVLLKFAEARENPFYHLVPEWGVWPLTILATIATIVASQAVISGVFSTCWQAIMLDYLPRMRVVHTSRTQVGQVYVPAINYFLCIATIFAVIFFKESEKLVVAYGLSVSGVMLITTVMVFLVAYNRWGWSIRRLMLFFIPMAFIDCVFVVTNMAKLMEGAWYPIIATIIAMYVIRTWIKGNQALSQDRGGERSELGPYIEAYQKKCSQTIPQTAIFMSRRPCRVPTALVLHLQTNKFLHKKMVFISIVISGSPVVRRDKKFEFRKILENVFCITVYYGFKEIPDVNRIIRAAKERKILDDNEEFSFFLSRSVAVASKKKVLTGFAEKLYVFMSKNALASYEFFRLPDEKVMELGVRYKV